MKLDSNQIPQADSLEDVVQTIQAVNTGHTSFQAIAAYIHKVERQGRYYRRAAEILGFLSKESPNVSTVTDLGHMLLSSSYNERNEIIAQAILSTHWFQRLMPFIETNSEGLTRQQIRDFLEK